MLNRDNGYVGMYDHVQVDPADVDVETHRVLAACPWILTICDVSMGIYPDKLIPQRIIDHERNNGHDTSTAVIRLATFEEIRPGIEYSCKALKFSEKDRLKALVRQEREKARKLNQASS